MWIPKDIVRKFLQAHLLVLEHMTTSSKQTGKIKFCYFVLLKKHCYNAAVTTFAKYTGTRTSI